MSADDYCARWREAGSAARSDTLIHHGALTESKSPSVFNLGTPGRKRGRGREEEIETGVDGERQREMKRRYGGKRGQKKRG